VLANRDGVGPSGEFVGVQPQPPHVCVVCPSRNVAGRAFHVVDPEALVVERRREGTQQSRPGFDRSSHGPVRAPVVHEVDLFATLLESVLHARRDDVLVEPCADDAEQAKRCEGNRCRRLVLVNSSVATCDSRDSHDRALERAFTDRVARPPHDPRSHERCHQRLVPLAEQNTRPINDDNAAEGARQPNRRTADERRPTTATCH
jgi:hypothetical protein